MSDPPGSAEFALLLPAGDEDARPRMAGPGTPKGCGRACSAKEAPSKTSSCWRPAGWRRGSAGRSRRPGALRPAGAPRPCRLIFKAIRLVQQQLGAAFREASAEAEIAQRSSQIAKPYTHSAQPTGPESGPGWTRAFVDAVMGQV